MVTVLVIAGCLLLNAFLSAFEMAFITASRPDLRRLVAEGDKTAEKLLALRNDPERTLSLIQIGITLLAAVSGAAGGAGAVERIRPWLTERFALDYGWAEVLSIGLVVIPLTYLTVVAGELVPKARALRSPVKLALIGTRWVEIADSLLSPAVSVLEWSTKKALRLFFPQLKPKVPPAAPITMELDTLSAEHRQYVFNLLDLERKTLGEIYVPWNEVVSVDRTFSPEEVMQVALRSRHTRLPVREENNVAGLLHTKEFMAYTATGERDWQNMIRPMLHFKASTPLLRAMKQMQQARSHMVLVDSDKSGLLGMVTLEDILEEVVGDIYDEDDDQLLKRLLASRAQVRRARTRK